MTAKEKDRRRKALGKEGEDMACSLLESRGFVILRRNWRYSHREIDIICADGCDLHFVEVKTRMEPMEGDPLDAVDDSKQRNVAFAAKAFLSTEARDLPFEVNECHFDVITTVWDETGATRSTEYIPDAFYLIYV